MKQILFGLFFLLPYPTLHARAHNASVLVVYYSVNGHTRRRKVACHWLASLENTDVACYAR
jgi:hypothetical protein